MCLLCVRGGDSWIVFSQRLNQQPERLQIHHQSSHEPCKTEATARGQQRRPGRAGVAALQVLDAGLSVVLEYVRVPMRERGARGRGGAAVAQLQRPARSLDPIGLLRILAASADLNNASKTTTPSSAICCTWYDFLPPPPPCEVGASLRVAACLLTPPAPLPPLLSWHASLTVGCLVVMA